MHLASLGPGMGLLSLNTYWQKPSSNNITAFWVVIAVKPGRSPQIWDFTVVERESKQ
jgi:hypothetical protein